MLKDSLNSISSKSSSDLNNVEVLAIDNEIKTALSDTQKHDKILAFIAKIKMAVDTQSYPSMGVRHAHITMFVLPPP